MAELLNPGLTEEQQKASTTAAPTSEISRRLSAARASKAVEKQAPKGAYPAHLAARKGAAPALELLLDTLREPSAFATDVAPGAHYGDTELGATLPHEAAWARVACRRV